MGRVGFTMVEALMTTLFVGLAAAVLTPALTTDLAVGQNLLARRLTSSGVIETQLDLACDQAAAGNFDSLVISAPLTAFPPELQGATGTRSGSYLDASLNPTATQTNLLYVQLNVAWTFRGHPMQAASPWYIISRAGLCGNGT